MFAGSKLGVSSVADWITSPAPLNEKKCGRNAILSEINTVVRRSQPHENREDSVCYTYRQLPLGKVWHITVLRTSPWWSSGLVRQLINPCAHAQQGLLYLVCLCVCLFIEWSVCLLLLICRPRLQGGNRVIPTASVLRRHNGAFFLKLFRCEDTAFFACRGAVGYFCLPATIIHVRILFTHVRVLLYTAIYWPQ